MTSNRPEGEVLLSPRQVAQQLGHHPKHSFYLETGRRRTQVRSHLAAVHSLPPQGSRGVDRGAHPHLDQRPRERSCLSSSSSSSSSSSELAPAPLGASSPSPPLGPPSRSSSPSPGQLQEQLPPGAPPGSSSSPEVLLHLEPLSRAAEQLDEPGLPVHREPSTSSSRSCYPAARLRGQGSSQRAAPSSGSSIWPSSSPEEQRQLPGQQLQQLLQQQLPARELLLAKELDSGSTETHPQSTRELGGAPPARPDRRSDGTP